MKNWDPFPRVPDLLLSRVEMSRVEMTREELTRDLEIACARYDCQTMCRTRNCCVSKEPESKQIED